MIHKSRISYLRRGDSMLKLKMERTMKEKKLFQSQLLITQWRARKKPLMRNRTLFRVTTWDIKVGQDSIKERKEN